MIINRKYEKIKYFIILLAIIFAVVFITFAVAQDKNDDKMKQIIEAAKRREIPALQKILNDLEKERQSIQKEKESLAEEKKHLETVKQEAKLEIDKLNAKAKEDKMKQVIEEAKSREVPALQKIFKDLEKERQSIQKEKESLTEEKKKLETVGKEVKSEINKLTVMKNKKQVIEEANTREVPVSDLQKVFYDLEAKRQSIQKEEENLAKEKKNLAVIKYEIESKIVKLTAIQKKIENDLNEMKGVETEQEQKARLEEQTRTKRLVKVYINMNARKAAALIDKLDMKVILQLFLNMKGAQISKILTYVKTNRAAEISERLAASKKTNNK